MQVLKHTRLAMVEGAVDEVVSDGVLRQHFPTNNTGHRRYLESRLEARRIDEGVDDLGDTTIRASAIVLTSRARRNILFARVDAPQRLVGAAWMLTQANRRASRELRNHVRRHTKLGRNWACQIWSGQPDTRLNGYRGRIVSMHTLIPQVLACASGSFVINPGRMIKHMDGALTILEHVPRIRLWPNTPRWSLGHTKATERSVDRGNLSGVLGLQVGLHHRVGEYTITCDAEQIITITPWLTRFAVGVRKKVRN